MYDTDTELSFKCAVLNITQEKTVCGLNGLFFANLKRS